MKIVLTVEVELRFVSGKFASREEIVERLADEIADPGTISVGEAEYEVESWTVEGGSA